MATLTNTIPEKTIERLSEYRRTLLASHRQGITHIFSHVLAGIHGITAVQVRRDLMLIGFSSDTKKGYDVQVLIEYISRILDSPSPMNIAVLGMGHLGQAITKYFNGKGLKLKITAAFDVDPEKVGKTIDGIPCYHMDSFEEVVGQGHLDRHRLLADEGGSESRAADHQCRHTGGAEFHLHAAELPAGDHRRELRHHHAARKSRLLRQGERREQFVTVCRRGREMRVFHGFDALPHFVRPAVTVGSYDGVHLGHRALIGRLIAEARANGGESIVLTFEPHPRITLGKAEGLRLLTTLDEKTALLEELGVDNVIVIPFDRAFSALSGEEFADDYLIGKVGAETLVAGYNHRFGHDRIDCDTLAASGRLRVVKVGPCRVDGVHVSSTVIRRLLDEGKTAEAELLLGYSLQTEK